jgi:hypothetical protein
MNSDEQYNDMLIEITKVAQESYKQEKDRASLLLTKSDYIIKYVTATFVFINALCALLIANKVVPLTLVCILYLIVGILLCISLSLSIKAQLLVKGEYFPTGVDILSEMKQNYDKNGHEKSLVDLKFDTLKYLDKYTKALEAANNDKAKTLNKAYRAYLSGIISITIIFFILCVIIA